MGIVKKNAIMMVDFAIEAERDARRCRRAAAIEEACLLRFRPIMMTTMAALLGALPLVLERGTGSELRFPLGVTIVGGLLLSQLLTLYTTPAIYLAFERLRAAARAAAAGAGGRRSSAMGFSALFIRRPGRHHPAGDRAAAGRRGRLPVPAGRRAAQRRHPHHRRVRQPAPAPIPKPWPPPSPRRWSAASARSPA